MRAGLGEAYCGVVVPIGQMTAEAADDPVVILGAGYAGLMAAQEVARRSRGKVPVTLVDRHPVHVLRTELYEVGRMAEVEARPGRWTVPLETVFAGSTVQLRQGEVVRIDLDRHEVAFEAEAMPFGQLVIALGNVAAFYGVPGARENTEKVYRLSEALALGQHLMDVLRTSTQLPGERRPRVIVVGGGSTGTEVAAEIASTDWARLVGGPVRPPDVFLVTGALPFLDGLPPPVVERARRLLRRLGVTIVYGLNARSVERGLLILEDGTSLAFDVGVWCAGLEAPPLVRQLPVAHGRAGRVVVDSRLEVPGRPGVFAVGDSAEWRDPVTGTAAPATAQAALQEARVAGRNVLARRSGSELAPFRYRDRGVVVALGPRRAAGKLRHLNLWSSPAALLKHAVEREYSRAVAHGEASRVL